MLQADGLGVALVRNNKDYNEKNVSQDHMEQSLRDKKGDQFPEDRRLAHYAAIHRQIRNDSDEVVKVAIRFEPQRFKMFAGDILQVKILVDKSTHTHHIGEPTGGFVEAEVLGMPHFDKGIALPCSKSRKVLSAGIRSTSRGFRAAPDTVAIFITRGRFASDCKSSRKDLGFTPIASKNGHTYAFQFQCLAKGSPLATGPFPKPNSILAMRPSSNHAEMQRRLTTPALPSPKPRITATSSTPRLSNPATERNAQATVGRNLGGASQTTIAFTTTKRKATSQMSAYSPSSDYDGSTVKKHKFSSPAGLTGKPAMNISVPTPTMPQVTPVADGQDVHLAISPRASIASNASKQGRDVIDLTLDDSADEKEILVKPASAVLIGMGEVPGKPIIAREDKEESDAEDVLLELREVQLQRRLRAMQKKSRQGKVEGNEIKQEGA